MIDINDFNIAFSSICFLLAFLALCVLYRKNMVGIYDPLLYHVLWLASHFALLSAVFEKNGLNILTTWFFLLFFTYCFWLKILLPSVSGRRLLILRSKIDSGFSGEKFVLQLMCLSFFVWLYSNSSFIEFAYTKSPSEWFSYRYIELQGRDPLLRVLEDGITPAFIFLTSYSIFFKANRFSALIFLVAYLAISLLSGGRSALLNLVFLLGTFVYFYEPFFSRNLKRAFSVVGLLVGSLGVLALVFVNSMLYGGGWYKSLYIFLNRVMANGDGLLYYIEHNGIEEINHGLSSYIMSVFGIYVNRIFGAQYKNVGHQLSELAVGHDLGFAQGANYTIFLQVMVLGFFTAPFYMFFISYCVAKLRAMKPTNGIMSSIFAFSMVLISFGIVSDLEYTVFRVLSFLTVFILVLYPSYAIISLFESSKNKFMKIYRSR